MKILVKNSYHNTEEVIESSSLEEAVKKTEELLSITADWLTENEVEPDWEKYYDSYDEAYDSTYDGILEQLVSEMSYEIIN